MPQEYRSSTRVTRKDDGVVYFRLDIDALNVARAGCVFGLARDGTNTEFFRSNCQSFSLLHFERFCYNRDTMKGRKKKREERPVFDAIRKPLAPPGHKFGEEKPTERSHPALRKVKHKKKLDPETNDADF